MIIGVLNKVKEVAVFQVREGIGANSKKPYRMVRHMFIGLSVNPDESVDRIAVEIEDRSSEAFDPQFPIAKLRQPECPEVGKAAAFVLDGIREYKGETIWQARSLATSEECELVAGVLMQS